MAIGLPPLQALTQTSANFNLSWSVTPKVTYQVQYNTNLTQSAWINLGGPVTATTGTLTRTDVNPADAQRFYRIIIVP